MGKIIMIGAMKGGVGKSVMAFNLAYSLQKKGKKVLAVDFDPQSNLTTCFGAEDVDVAIGDLMMSVLEEEELPDRSEYIWERNGVDFIPSSIGLSAVEAKLRLEMGTEKMLSSILEPLRGDYDYILIDCQPSLGVLVLNALVAADGAIIPAQTQEFSRKALKAITDIIGQVQATINPNLKLLGILPTMVDNTAMSKDTRKVFEDNYGELVFPMNISRSVTAAYSSKEKKALCFKANSKLGEEYRQFADEVVRRITA